MKTYKRFGYACWSIKEYLTIKLNTTRRRNGLRILTYNNGKGNN